MRFTALLVALLACGSTPKPKAPPVSTPTPPATIVVTPAPTTCVLPKAPAALGPSGAKSMPAGRWTLLDEAGHQGHEVIVVNGVHVPREWWDAYGRYVLGLQEVVIAAKRCHPETPNVTPPAAAPIGDRDVKPENVSQPSEAP